ncbi:MAG: phytanoyl-CoA dioxygenase family protein [Chloroflexi bacterium]|nr:phytanoyl-CoA dioxygenase family protein [Chloroflexota bacterium]MCY3938440.1 phytanoyl-CoA dioxygenase family protein [Chloroflexota bacterium]
MNEHEKYLFDLQGYVAVPNALDSDTLERLNGVLDERIAGEVPEDADTYRFIDCLPWGQPYLDLIDHETILPYLETVIGPGYRLDHTYVDIIRAGLSPIGATLHGGAIPFSPINYFQFSDGRFYNGLSVVAYNLADVNPGDGGFACVPGSHKSNYALPDDWVDLTKSNSHPSVEKVTGAAGTAIIFTEALAHGPLPWTASHERRTIFYKYSPPSLAWWDEYPTPEGIGGLTERQKAILEGPNARYAWRARAQ